MRQKCESRSLFGQFFLGYSENELTIWNTNRIMEQLSRLSDGQIGIFMMRKFSVEPWKVGTEMSDTVNNILHI